MMRSLAEEDFPNVVYSPPEFWEHSLGELPVLAAVHLVVVMISAVKYFVMD